MEKQKDKISDLTTLAIDLLKELIKIPSISGEELAAADLIGSFLDNSEIIYQRENNNIWANNKHFDTNKPTILLNSHHDTVKPNKGWTKDPFKFEIAGDKLFGLGTNDAGASLVSLLAAFLYVNSSDNLKYNLIFSATAEEETTGPLGISSVLNKFGKIDMAIVGEPTGMQMAVAEKGLIVLHCKAHGVAGHAAHNTGENAIMKAIEDINWFSTFQFPKKSQWLGPIKMTVTGINAGIQHNVIPDVCTYMVDIRTTDAYSHKQIIETITGNISAEIERCSNNLNPSALPQDHILIQKAEELGIKTFASPTLSDQAVIPAPSIKIGPGLSERSHTADEFVYFSEINDGVEGYVRLLGSLVLDT